MLAELLAQRILSLFCIIAMGFIMVRLEVIKPAETRGLSLMSLYVIVPCAILTAFQVPCTPQVQSGLFLAFAAAILIHVVLIALMALAGRVIQLDAVEKASIIYSNSANFIFPLVATLLGKEWVIYSIAFVSVQTILLWSHGKSILRGDSNIAWKELLKNINLIACVGGLFLFFTGLRLPGPLFNAMDTVGDMIGPAAMFITGALIASIDLRKMLIRSRIWFVVFIRLIAVPVLCCLILKYSGLTLLHPLGGSILLVTLLATATPSASTITQMAHVFGRNAPYASAINVMTTLGTIITMPLIVMLYQL